MHCFNFLCLTYFNFYFMFCLPPPLVWNNYQYTVLHWGAKYGNADIIKIFAGKYKVDVNGKTNGGYTPLHISAQFGHKELFKLLIEVYKADPNIRDYSGRTAEYYLLVKEHKQGPGITLRSEYTRDSLRHEKSRSKSFRHKTISLPTPVIVNSTFLFETNKRSATAKYSPGVEIKGRKKQTDKDLGFLRIGSLNVRVKKTTEAFSNFLGVGGGTISPLDTMHEKVHKGWGSADNVNKETTNGIAKGYSSKKKNRRTYESGRNSTPSTPKTPNRSFSSFQNNDSDSDTAAGFDSNWKN
ncbi:uncharacterized protein [Leptinotarsa decemlineata]|uniref:uncharacterized protein n=1 Tax=Leptinotarsa decemlineata TaxID=7539 RepID=UPI003D30A0C2